VRIASRFGLRVDGSGLLHAFMVDRVLQSRLAVQLAVGLELGF